MRLDRLKHPPRKSSYRRKKAFAEKQRKNPPRSEAMVRDYLEQRTVLDGWPPAKHIGDVHGYHVDFLFKEARLVLEVDGFFHRTPGQAEKDAEREEHIRGHGYHVIRITDEQVYDNLALALAPVYKFLMQHYQQPVDGRLKVKSARQKPADSRRLCLTCGKQFNGMYYAVYCSEQCRRVDKESLLKGR